MQTTPKQTPPKEEIVRLAREPGPLQFADGSELAAAFRLQQFGFDPAALLQNAPVAYAPPSYGLPPAPSFANVATPQAGWQQPSWAPVPPQGAFTPFALAQRILPQQAPFAAASGPNTHRLPLCDIVDEGAEFVLQLELPGVKRENVDVSCFERGVLVTATAHPDIDLGALVQAERGTVISYRRAINLPGQVTPSGVKASLNDGILTITLPKSNPTEGPRRVPVN